MKPLLLIIGAIVVFGAGYGLSVVQHKPKPIPPPVIITESLPMDAGRYDEQKPQQPDRNDNEIGNTKGVTSSQFIRDVQPGTPMLSVALKYGMPDPSSPNDFTLIYKCSDGDVYVRTFDDAEHPRPHLTANGWSELKPVRSVESVSRVSESALKPETLLDANKSSFDQTNRAHITQQQAASVELGISMDKLKSTLGPADMLRDDMEFSEKCYLTKDGGLAVYVYQDNGPASIVSGIRIIDSRGHTVKNKHDQFVKTAYPLTSDDHSIMQMQWDTIETVRQKEDN